MNNLRIYGKAPFTVAVIHGGPGAAGEMAPVAIELSRDHGVLEPLQTAFSIEGQVCELRSILEEHGDTPVTLIGHSWGAWLSIIFAARYPGLVEKLILVGCGVMEEKYAQQIMKTRLSRLNEHDQSDVMALIKSLDDPGAKDKNRAFSEFGKLMSKADSYDPVPQSAAGASMNGDSLISEGIFQAVWGEAEVLRRSGALQKLAKQVRCPVVAIHGDYDPSPAEGVEKPMRAAVKDFRFFLLRKCGHEPWMERAARDQFFNILKNELD